MTPIPNIFDTHAENYAEVVAAGLPDIADHAFIMQVKAESIKEQIKFLDNANRPIRLLDVGCGIGLLHKHLNQANLELHGVDMSTHSIEQAKLQHQHVTYQSYDGKTLPYADDFFDMCVAICVMHHVPKADWIGFLGELKRVTRGGGRVMIFEHNPMNPITQWLVHRCPLDKDAILLSQGNVKAMFRKIGISSQYYRYILYTPFKQGFFRKLDKYLGFLPFGTQYWVSGVVPDKMHISQSDVDAYSD